MTHPCLPHCGSWNALVTLRWCSQIAIPCFLTNVLLSSQNAHLCIICHKVSSCFCSPGPQVHPCLPRYCFAVPAGWSGLPPPSPRPGSLPRSPPWGEPGPVPLSIGTLPPQKEWHGPTILAFGDGKARWYEITSQGLPVQTKILF